MNAESVGPANRSQPFGPGCIPVSVAADTRSAASVHLAPGRGVEVDRGFRGGFYACASVASMFYLDAQWHRRPSLRFWEEWPEMICQRMNVTPPNEER